MIMEEIWKPVPEFEDLYQVSNLGRVKALSKRVNTWNGGKCLAEQMIKPVIQHSGYAHIGLWRQQKCKQVRLHRLVATVFCPNDDPSNKTQVNHINENKLDNRACNLEWCTAKQNTNHGTAIARRVYGRERAVECLDKTTGSTVRIFKSQAEANDWCGVSRYDGHISACCNGKQKTAYGYRWRYVEKEVMPDAE